MSLRDSILDPRKVPGGPSESAWHRAKRPNARFGHAVLPTVPEASGLVGSQRIEFSRNHNGWTTRNRDRHIGRMARIALLGRRELQRANFCVPQNVELDGIACGQAVDIFGG